MSTMCAQSSTQQKLWIILTKRVLFPGILDIIDRLLFAGVFLKQKNEALSRHYKVCTVPVPEVQIGQGNLEVAIIPVM